MNVWTVPLIVTKPADTSRNSGGTGTTLVADPDLVLPIAAGSTYDINSLIIYSGSPSGSGDLKFTFTGPAGHTGRYCPIRQNLSGSYTGWAMNQWTDNDSANTNGTGAGQYVSLFVKGILITAGAAGNLTFVWAQNTSSATSTIVRQNSYLYAQRIG